MRAKLTGTDDYLAQWRKSEPELCGDDLEAEASKAAEAFEAEFDRERLKSLVGNQGFASGS